jgi:hypothetical protein
MPFRNQFIAGYACGRPAFGRSAALRAGLRHKEGTISLLTQR